MNDQAAYEYRPIEPAVGSALLMCCVGFLLAIAVCALVPTTGWSSTQEAPIGVSGHELLARIWRAYEHGYPFWRVGDDLDRDVLIRLAAACLSGVCGATIGFQFTYATTPFVDRREHYNGPQLRAGTPAVKEAHAAMAARRALNERPIELAVGIPYPRHWRVLNLLIVGAIGSGKTRIILHLLDQLLKQILGARETIHSLLIHDTTGEILDGLPIEDGAFAVLHPHRPEGWGWAMGLDLLTMEDIEEAADQAIASTREAMWSKGASSIAAGCMLIAYAEHGCRWGMPEFYAAAMLPPRDMKLWFEKVYPIAAQLIEYDEAGELSKTSVGMLLTFRASVLRTLRPLAQAWAGLPPERLFSFSDWIRQAGRQPRIVVLQRSGRHPTMSALWIGMALDAIATYAGDEALGVTQTRTRTLVIDELPALGKLRKLPDLLDVGRNRGVCTIAAVQDLAQLDRIYGDLAKSLRQRFRLKIFGTQTPGPELKEIAEKEIGVRRVLDRSYPKTVTVGAQGRTVQVTEQQRIDTVPVVPEHHLAHHLGVHGKKVSAILIGLANPIQLDWPMTVWKKRR